MRKTITIGTFLLFGFGLMGADAQQAVTGAGGEASGAGGTSSYSVGQVVYTTNTGTNGTVAQGVQQPYEISVVASVQEVQNISLEAVVYPNPAQNELRLNIKNYNNENLRFQLFDINGKLLSSEQITASETVISMQSYATAIYFLKVIDASKEFITFKIIKN